MFLIILVLRNKFMSFVSLSTFFMIVGSLSKMYRVCSHWITFFLSEKWLIISWYDKKYIKFLSSIQFHDFSFRDWTVLEIHEENHLFPANLVAGQTLISTCGKRNSPLQTEHTKGRIWRRVWTLFIWWLLVIIVVCI